MRRLAVVAAALLFVVLSVTDVRAGVVPLVIDNVQPDPRPAAPVRFGVPFPIDALMPGEPVGIVDDTGAATVFESRPIAIWDPAGKRGVRWLLVSFPAEPNRSYKLLFGPDLKSSTPAAPPIASIKDGQITLNTGVLSGTISTTRADLFSGLVSLGAPVVTADDTDRFTGFFVEHEKLGLFRSDLDPSPTITLEESGPASATVRLDGWYTNRAGEKFCRYSIRARFFRGRADVKLDHTFIYTGLSKDDKIRAMGLQLPQKPGLRGSISGATEQLVTLAADFTSSAQFVQDSPDKDHIELLMLLPDGRRTKVAERSTGTMTYGATAATIRDAWQQYPWGLEVREGVMQVQLWPRSGRLLDTTFDGYWWFLSEHQKRFMLGTKAKVPADMDQWIALFRKAVNATGAAKTHELWLSFAAPDAVSARSFGVRLQRDVLFPTIGRADPIWTTQTRALDFCPHVPRDTARFGDEENYLLAVRSMVGQITEQRGWYGWWDWGGYYQIPGQPDVFARADSHGLERWHRNRPKSHYGWGQLPWVEYFRTGDRQWLRYAQTYTLYSADRSIVHHTAHGRNIGEEYHYDQSDIPWVGGWTNGPSGAGPSSNLQQKDDYVYMYWLTGERRALDVLQQWGEQILKNPGVVTSWKPGLEQGGDIRNSGMQLHRLTMLYQATWDPRYLALAKSVADKISRIQSVEEIIAVEKSRQTAPDAWNFHTAIGWMYEGLWLYYNVTQDPEVRRVLLLFVERSRRYDAGIGWGYGPMRGYVYGYLLTQDPVYLDLIRSITDDVVARWATPRAWRPDNEKFTTIVLSRGLAAMAQAGQSWQEANLPTSERGRRLRFRYASFRNSNPKAVTTVRLTETQDRAFSVTLLDSHGGQWAIFGPDGVQAAISAQRESPFDDKWLTLRVEPDGKTGVYTLRCVQPSKAWVDNTDPNYSADARVLYSDLPVGYNVSPVVDYGLTAWGRSVVFFANAPINTILNIVLVAGRDVDVLLDGRAAGGTRGVFPCFSGQTLVPLAVPATGAAVEVRPVTPPDRYYGDDNTVRAFPGYLWAPGLAPVLFASPADAKASRLDPVVSGK